MLTKSVFGWCCPAVAKGNCLGRGWSLSISAVLSYGRYRITMECNIVPVDWSL